MHAIYCYLSLCRHSTLEFLSFPCNFSILIFSVIEGATSLIISWLASPHLKQFPPKPVWFSVSDQNFTLEK